LEKKVVWACPEGFVWHSFQKERKIKTVDDWVDRCHLHIAAILERSDDLERKRNTKKRKKTRKEVARLTKFGRGKFGEMRGGSLLYDWCLGLMLHDVCVCFFIVSHVVVSLR